MTKLNVTTESAPSLRTNTKVSKTKTCLSMLNNVTNVASRRVRHRECTQDAGGSIIIMSNMYKIYLHIRNNVVHSPFIAFSLMSQLSLHIIIITNKPDLCFFLTNCLPNTVSTNRTAFYMLFWRKEPRFSEMFNN
jgi:hypothetical protein